MKHNIYNIRREFTLQRLDENDVMDNPFALFDIWFKEALSSKALEPNAMILSTSDKNGRISSRVVLLKQIKDEGFVFFTNYDSKKGKQIEENKFVALNFIWHELERQVRIEGVIEKVSEHDSDSYFEARPAKSKLGAWTSPQSRVIPNREYIEQLFFEFETQFAEKKITRPTNWGGYIVRPLLFEFWQGRESRLHDRIQYTFENKEWKIERLAP